MADRIDARAVNLGAGYREAGYQLPMSRLRENIAVIANKLDALAICLTAPLWPERTLLSESGRALYDAILADAKEYVLKIVEGKYTEALAMAAKWPVDEFMEGTLVNDPDDSIAGANARLLAVYRHYMDAMGIDFGKLS